MQKLIYFIVFVSFMVAVMFWATSEVDYLLFANGIDPYLIGT